MSRPGVTVLKFGSSVLRDPADLPAVAAEIAARVSHGDRVLAVVSAIGNGTDELIRRARSLMPGVAAITDRAAASDGSRIDAIADCGAASDGVGTDTAADCAAAAYAALLGTGEVTSAALLSLTLSGAGIVAPVLDPGCVGPYTRGPRLEAEPVALDAGSIRRVLEQAPVAVLPGFVGRDEHGRHSLLGRGGSDLTALFAARALSADCRLLKDVDGIYEHDPALPGLPRPRRFATLDWEGALRLDDCILQRRATLFAQRHEVCFSVGSLGTARGTVVGAPVTRLDGPAGAGPACAGNAPTQGRRRGDDRIAVLEGGLAS